MLTAPVTWTADNLDGTTPEGVIEFRPAAGVIRYTDATGARFKIGLITADIDATGKATANIPVTDQAGIDPQGFTWVVTERLRATAGRSYAIAVTTADIAAGVSIAADAPIPTTLGDRALWADTPDPTTTDYLLGALLDQRVSRRVTIAIVGDSIAQGALADAPVHTNRALAHLRRRVRQLYPATAPGSIGHIPAYWAGGLLGTPPATSGNVTPAPDWTWGTAGGSALMMVGGNTPSDTTLTFPATPATRIRVHYGKGDAYVGHFAIWIDGADRTADGTLLPAGTASGPTVSCVGNDDGAGFTKSDGYAWQSPILPAGNHTVVIKAVSKDFTAIIEGVEYLDGDEAQGIHIIDCTHSGATAADFAAATLPWQAITAQAPDIALVLLGANDAVATTRPDFTAALTTICNKLEAAGTRRIILVHPYRPLRSSQGADAVRWQEHRSARAEVAAARPDLIRLFDLAAYWPIITADYDDAGLMLWDDLHLTQAGQARLADVLLRPLLASVPGP